MRCIWLLWSLLAWLAACLCTVGCLLPYWLKGSVYILTPNNAIKGQSLDDAVTKPPTVNAGIQLPVGLATDLGLFRRCGYPVYANWMSTDRPKSRRSDGQPVQWQTGCGHYSHLTHVPHMAWHVGFFTLVTACALLFFTTFFLFLMGFTLYLITLRSVCRACQSLLFISGLLTLVTCALYPVGWTDNSEVRQACGDEANSFNLGRCHIGWAYVLTCSGGLLSLFAATLPILFPKHIKQTTSRGFRSLTDGSHRTKGLANRGNNPRLSCTRRSSSCPSDSLSHTGSLPGGSVAAFVQPHVPSPAHSLAVSHTNDHPRHNQPQLGSVLFLPSASTAVCTGGASPSGSSFSLGPDPSVVGKAPLPVRVTPDQDVTWHSSHLLAPRHLLRAAHPPYPFLTTTYTHQRYSTGALLGHFYSVNNQPRVTPSLNTDPLIYVAEEEEWDQDYADQNGPVSDRNHGTDLIDKAVSKLHDLTENTTSPTEVCARPLHIDPRRPGPDSEQSRCFSNSVTAVTTTADGTPLAMRWIDPRTYSSTDDTLKPKRASCAL